MAFNVEQAFRDGYSEDEILEHLTATRKFDIQSALKDGYSKREIIDHLASSQPKKAAEESGLPATGRGSGLKGALRDFWVLRDQAGDMTWAGVPQASVDLVAPTARKFTNQLAEIFTENEPTDELGEAFGLRETTPPEQTQPVVDALRSDRKVIDRELAAIRPPGKANIMQDVVLGLPTAATDLAVGVGASAINPSLGFMYFGARGGLDARDELREKGQNPSWAWVDAIAAGALDRIVPEAKFAGGVLRRILKSAAMEGSTEAAEELITSVRKHATTDPGYLGSDRFWHDLAASGISGAILGGPVGGLKSETWDGKVAEVASEIDKQPVEQAKQAEPANPASTPAPENAQDLASMLAGNLGTSVEEIQAGQAQAKTQPETPAEQEARLAVEQAKAQPSATAPLIPDDLGINPYAPTPGTGKSAQETAEQARKRAAREKAEAEKPKKKKGSPLSSTEEELARLNPWTQPQGSPTGDVIREAMERQRLADEQAKAEAEAKKAQKSKPAEKAEPAAAPQAKEKSEAEALEEQARLERAKNKLERERLKAETNEQLQKKNARDKGLIAARDELAVLATEREKASPERQAEIDARREQVLTEFPVLRPNPDKPKAERPVKPAKPAEPVEPEVADDVQDDPAEDVPEEAPEPEDHPHAYRFPEGASIEDAKGRKLTVTGFASKNPDHGFYKAKTETGESVLVREDQAREPQKVSERPAEKPAEKPVEPAAEPAAPAPKAEAKPKAEPKPKRAPKPKAEKPQAAKRKRYGDYEQLEQAVERGDHQEGDVVELFDEESGEAVPHTVIRHPEIGLLAREGTPESIAKEEQELVALFSAKDQEVTGERTREDVTQLRERLGEVAPLLNTGTFENGFDYSPEEAKLVQDNLDGKTLQDAARFVMKRGAPFQRLLAGRALVALNQLEKAGFTLLPIEFRYVERKRGTSSIALKSGSDTYTLSMRLNPADSEHRAGVEVVLHELMHAVTSPVTLVGERGEIRRLPVSAEMVKRYSELHDIYKHVLRHLGENLMRKNAPHIFERLVQAGVETNTLADPDELLAWGTTNPLVREYLSTIPYPKEPNQSLWSAFVHAARKLLGLDNKYYSALDALLVQSERLMDAKLSREFIQGARALQAERNKSSDMDTGPTNPELAAVLAAARTEIRLNKKYPDFVKAMVGHLPGVFDGHKLYELYLDAANLNGIPEKELTPLSEVDKFIRANHLGRATPAVPKPLVDFSGFKAKAKEKSKEAIETGKALVRSRGFLPELIHKMKITRDGFINARRKEIDYAIADLDAGIAELYGSWEKTPENIKTNLNAALGYSLADIAQLPEEFLPARLKPTVSAMRVHVDAMTGHLKRIGMFEGPLAIHVDENLGAYLHRGYEIFDNPDYAKKIAPETKQRVLDFLAFEYPEKTQAEHMQMLQELIDHPDASANKAGDSSNFVTRRLGAKNLSALKERKDIPAAIRELWGEYKDARMNYASTLTNMAYLAGNHKLLTDIRRHLLETGQASEGKKDFAKNQTKLLAPEGKDQLSPLDGLYVDNDMYRALTEFRAGTGERATMFEKYVLPAYMLLVRANGTAKYGKTVLSGQTHVRNFISNAGFAAANGHINAFRYTGQALKTSFSRLSKATGDERKLMTQLIELGVLYEEPTASELRAIRKELAAVAPLSMAGTQLGRFMGQVNQGLKLTEDVYMAEDNVWKIIHVLGEADRYRPIIQKQNPDASPQEIERRVLRQAASIVRRTHPTYSLTPPAVKLIRQFPFLGPFVAFPAEVLRTSYGTMTLAVEEIQNPATRMIGIRRLMAFSATAILPTLAGAASLSLLGYDDDDLERLRKLSPEYSKNSPLLMLPREEGKVRAIDLGNLDPFNYLHKPMIAFGRGLSDKDLVASFRNSLTELLDPVLSEELVSKPLRQFLANNNEYGQRLYAEKTGPLTLADRQERAGVFLEMMFGVNPMRDTENFITNPGAPFMPGSPVSARRFYMGLTGAKEENGTTYRAWEEALAPVVRIQHNEIAKTLRAKAAALAGANREIPADRPAFKPGTKMAGKQSSLERGDQVYADNMLAFKDVVSSALALGMTRKEVEETLVGVLGRDEIETALTGSVPEHISRKRARSRARVEDGLYGE
jgi:hypothetical protein